MRIPLTVTIGAKVDKETSKPVFEPLDETLANLDMLADNHVSAVELVNGQYLLEKSTSELIALKKNFDERGIEIASIHAPFGENHDLAALSDAERCQALEIQKKVLPLAALLGARVVVIHPGVQVKSSLRDAASQALMKSLPELTRVAEEVGILLGLENNEPGYMGDDADALLGWVEQVNSPALGICFDTGHAHCNGTMRESFAILKDRIVAFHLSDNDGTCDQHLQPGHGTIDWQAFKEIFQTMSFAEPLNVEVIPSLDTSYRTMMDEVTSLLENV